MVGGKRSWFQAVPLLESQIVGTPDVSLDESGTVVPLQQGPQIAVLPPLNGAKLVDIRGAPLVFVGYGVDAPERGWNDFKGQDMHGKILVELVNDPDFEAGGEPVAGKFGGKAMTYYGRWTYKYEEAARQGAAGVILIHETLPASYPWQVVETSNTVPEFDIVRDDPASQHTPFESWVQRPIAADIFRHAGLDLDQAKVAARRSDFRPIELKDDTVGPLFGGNADDLEPQCRRLVARCKAFRRDDRLFRPLGPFGHRQARFDRRHHLQWRSRQCDGRQHGDRAGARLRAGSASRPFDRLPAADGGRKDCWEAPTTQRIRSTRLPEPWPCSTLMR